MEKSTFLVIFVKVEGWMRDQNDRQILTVILVLYPALYLYKNPEKSRFFVDFCVKNRKNQLFYGKIDFSRDFCKGRGLDEGPK